MIRWFLATLHLSHLQADDNYACHLLTAKIFQIGLSENVVHLYTYGHFVEKRPVPMQWNWCLPTNFRYLSPNGAPPSQVRCGARLWCCHPLAEWCYHPQHRGTLVKGIFGPWKKNLEIWWWFCSKIGSLILAWRELILGNWDLRLKNLWKSPSKKMERNRMGVCRCFSQWAVL